VVVLADREEHVRAGQPRVRREGEVHRVVVGAGDEPDHPGQVRVAVGRVREDDLEPGGRQVRGHLLAEDAVRTHHPASVRQSLAQRGSSEPGGLMSQLTS
jgi:hypothetical protein